ncbi:PaaX family transcriptional regulator [Nesterenkonia marinintestina]|uniref:PaaX family transcriptional regulator n=1 Tax=Nesterenkonia marinintestina TaxID=2979865 RepID=UPI0021BE7BEE|nr:PaaX family transcriptional regulator C-terminal domain-containing protein [Nesterenkonia sp. GX14115]
MTVPLPPYRELVLTAFGLFGRNGQEWIPVGTLVRLLEDCGADAPGVRATISRMTKRGNLENRRRGRNSEYRLSPNLVYAFSSGDRRIFEPVRASPDDPWLLVTFSVSESQRDVRHRLRSGLSRLGFGTISPGLWIAPVHVEEEARQYLERHGLMEHTAIFRAHSVHGGPDADWWNLDLLESRYSWFLQAYTEVSERVDESDSSLQTAFSVYMVMLTHWRQLPYLDPGLPDDMLPPTWPGHRAWDLFIALDRALHAAADEYARSVLEEDAVQASS